MSITRLNIILYLPFGFVVLDTFVCIVFPLDNILLHSYYFFVDPICFGFSWYFNRALIRCPNLQLLSGNINQHFILCKSHIANLFLQSSRHRVGTWFSSVLATALPLDRTFGLLFLDRFFEFTFHLHCYCLHEEVFLFAFQQLHHHWLMKMMPSQGSK